MYFLRHILTDRDWSFWPGPGLILNSYVFMTSSTILYIYIFLFKTRFISDLLSNLTLIL